MKAPALPVPSALAGAAAVEWPDVRAGPPVVQTATPRLWRLDLTLPLGPADRLLLSAEERQRAQRFVFEDDRQRFEAAHLGMRHLLGRQAGVAPGELQFEAGPWGKPALRGRQRGGFNLSHSGDVGLLLWVPDDLECGVDVEVLRPVRDRDAVARSVFTAEECRALEAMPAATRDEAFLRLWTRKEACIKAIGTGLALAPRLLQVGLDTPARELSVAFPAELADSLGGSARLFVLDLQVGPDVRAAAAFRLDGAGAGPSKGTAPEPDRAIHWPHIRRA